MPIQTRATAHSQQGFNDVGYSSNDLMGLTPVLDGLAAGGIKLRQYYGQQVDPQPAKIHPNMIQN